MKKGMFCLMILILTAGTSFGFGSIGTQVNQFCADDPYTGDCTLCHVSGDFGATTPAKTAASNEEFCFFCPEDPSCAGNGGGDCTDADMDGFAVEGGDCGMVDCNDQDPAINPGAAERCDDNVDNNCDGLIDGQDTDSCPPGQDCTDVDQDGYYAEGQPCGTAKDCNDSDKNIHPGATESCDSMDNDCDGQIDEGCDGGACDADTLYFENCASCHGEIPNSDVCGASAKKITRAITENKGGMASLCGLTNSQIQLISEALSQCKADNGTPGKDADDCQWEKDKCKDKEKYKKDKKNHSKRDKDCRKDGGNEYWDHHDEKDRDCDRTKKYSKGGEKDDEGNGHGKKQSMSNKKYAHDEGNKS